MPDEPTGKGLSLTSMVTAVVVFIAAFLVLRFVFSFAMSILKWVLIAGVAVLAAWYFMKKGPGSGSSS